MEYLFETAFINALVPLAMDEFCANFNNTDGICTTEVRGKKIKFSKETLAKIWEVSCKGTDVYFKRKGTVSFPNFPQYKIVESFGGTVGQNKINHNLLSPVHKILFNLVWRALIPRICVTCFALTTTFK